MAKQDPAKFKLFVNHDAATGLPAHLSGYEPGFKWLLKKKGADLSQDGLPLLISNSYVGGLNPAAGGNIDCWTGIQLAFIEEGEYKVEFVDQAGLEEYYSLANSWSPSRQKVILSLRGKSSGSHREDGAYVLLDLETAERSEIVTLTDSPEVQKTSAFHLSRSALVFTSKGGAEYMVGRPNAGANDKFIIYDTTNNVRYAVWHGKSGFQGNSPVFSVLSTGDVLVAFNFPNRNPKQVEVAILDPATQTLTWKPTWSLPTGSGNHLRVYPSVASTSDLYAVFAHWASAASGGYRTLRLSSRSIATGAQVSSVDLSVPYYSTAPADMTQYQNIGSGKLFGCPSSGAPAGQPTFCLPHSVSVDASGQLSAASMNVIYSNNVTGINYQVGGGLNLSERYWIDRSMTVYPQSTPTIIDVDTLQQKVPYDKVSSQFAREAVALEDLRMAAAFTAMYIPHDESGEETQHVSVLISTMEGGKWDGLVPLKGNFMAKIEDPSSERQDAQFRIMSVTPVDRMDASCILDGPGVIIELEEV
jgi:hypothetical protein